MFALPLINVHRVKRWFTQLTKLKEDNKGINVIVTRNELCAVCNDVPVIPQEAECHHIFCYYCLKVRV